MPLQPKNKTRAIIFNALSPILIVLVFGGVVAPSYVYLLQPRVQLYLNGGELNLKAIREKLTDREQYLADLKSFHAFYEERGAQGNDALSVLLPLVPDNESLFGFFEEIAPDGVQLEAIDIAPQLPKKGKQTIQNITVALSYVGVQYETLKLLLGALETNKRLIDVDSFSFDPVGRLATLTVKLYYAQARK
ncbi:hypothetical protein HYV71_04150 [Candidatus Uhrbacteria bacterium]|nr:hypothetical protein [Candidatus Uhrbacteria bacterium]